MNERLKNNIAILKQHNLTHRPVFHITDGHKHEIDLINEIVEDCEEIFNDEEQGLIVRLPCRVGDNLYLPYIYDSVKGVATLTVTKVSLDEKGVVCTNLESDSSYFLHRYNYGTFWFNEIGEIIFPTRAEAEKKLKELKGEK